MDRMDAMINDLEKFMENHRESNGITKDLKSYADLSCKEFNSIESFLLYSSDGDNEINAVRSGFKKIILTFQKVLSSKKSLTNKFEQIKKSNRKARIESIIIIIVILLLIAVLTFSNEYITVVPSDGTVYLVQKNGGVYQKITWK